MYVCAVTEIAKAQQTGRIPIRDAKYVDIYREKPIRVTVKVLVPVKEHPKVRASSYSCGWLCTGFIDAFDYSSISWVNFWGQRGIR